MSAAPAPGSAAHDDAVDLAALVERIAAQARPGEQIEAFAARSVDRSVRVYEGEVEQLQRAQSQGVGIRVIADHRVGFAYTGAIDEASLAETLAEARDNRGFAEPDEYAGLPAPDGVAMAELDLWRDGIDAIPNGRIIELALELERRALALDARVHLESSEYVDALVEAAVANSLGVRAAGRENGCYVVASTLADDGDETQTGFGFSVGRHPDELDIGVAATEAVERAVRLLGAVKPPTRRTTVVFDPWVTAQFLSVLGATLDGESVAKGRSLFAGRLGDAVANPLLTLVDDPTNPLAYTATRFDGEGLATRRNVLLDAGRLAMFVQSSYSGRRSGVASTGNAVRGGYKGTPGAGCMALSLVPGTGTPDELVRLAGDGVLVQEVNGIHSGVNPISGDFSTGASGLVIRGGVAAEPIREFTLGSTIQRMLLDVVAVGADITWLPMGAAGVSLVIDGVTVSGT